MKERKDFMGPGGKCVCIKCGEAIPHKNGVPCETEKCPECGGRMVREGSEHHKAMEEKKAKKKEEVNS